MLADVGIIYKVTNVINNKIYIGQTTQSLKKRMCGHKYDLKNKSYNSLLHNAIKKYGWNAFIWEKIECVKKTDLNEKEMFYINELNTIKPNGYNLTLGGGGNYGYKWSDESKLTFSQKVSGKILTDAHKEKIRVSMLGKNKGKCFGNNSSSKRPEVRKKLSEKSRRYSDNIINYVINLREKTHIPFKKISDMVGIPTGTIQDWCNKKYKFLKEDFDCAC